MGFSEYTSASKVTMPKRRNSIATTSTRMNHHDVATYTSNCYETCYQSSWISMGSNNDDDSLNSSQSSINADDWYFDEENELNCLYTSIEESHGNITKMSQANRETGRDDDDDAGPPQTKLLRMAASCWLYYPHSTMILPKEYYHISTQNSEDDQGSTTTTIRPNWIEITKLPPTSGPMAIFVD